MEESEKIAEHARKAEERSRLVQKKGEAQRQEDRERHNMERSPSNSKKKKK
jgi:hypothetical protein